MPPHPLLAAARKIAAPITAIRRDLHMHPEIGFDLPRTAGIVAAEMQSLGLNVRSGVGKSGVVADLEVSGATERVALRADMDALEIEEQNDVPYRSTVPGRGHMCGHDAHTAMLIGAARLLCERRGELTRNVRFIFQPNEENLPGGAPAMIADGALGDVDRIYGLHVWPYHDAGTIGICDGPALGQPDMFTITLTGIGGHAAFPHDVVDPIVAGAHLVTQLQTIVSRTVDPRQAAVLSVTQFHAGTADNIIPERALLNGTVRTFDAAVQRTIRDRLEAIVAGVAATHGVQADLTYSEGYPVTVNHPEGVRRARAGAEALCGTERLHYPDTPALGGEDFAYFLRERPGCFLFLGVRNTAEGKVHMLHDPRFDIDEATLPLGMALHAWLGMEG